MPHSAKSRRAVVLVSSWCQAARASTHFRRVECPESLSRFSWLLPAASHKLLRNRYQFQNSFYPARRLRYSVTFISNADLSCHASFTQQAQGQEWPNQLVQLSRRLKICRQSFFWWDFYPSLVSSLLSVCWLAFVVVSKSYYVDQRWACCVA